MTPILTALACGLVCWVIAIIAFYAGRHSTNHTRGERK